jgi:LacI family transcriptional regulator
MAPPRSKRILPKRAENIPGRAPDIRQVAQRAGVGIASVSRVLSGQPGSSTELTARVLEAAKQLGYTPNILAQGLRRRSTRSIGFVGSDITNPLLAAIVQGAERVFSSAGYSILLTNSGGIPEIDAQRIEVLRQRQVDGLIILPALEDDPATLAALRSVDTPVVVIDRALPPDLKVHYVLSDHYRGVGEAARYLLKNKHRRIGLAVGRDVRPSRERIHAVMDAYKTLKLEPDVVVDFGTLSAEHGASAMERFLSMATPRTAIILGGNQLLEGALQVVRNRGIRLGEELSVVCCDDIPLGRLYDPPIATIMRDSGLLGERAAGVLLDQTKASHPTEPIVLPTWFELRPSCAPLAPTKQQRRRRTT